MYRRFLEAKKISGGKKQFCKPAQNSTIMRGRAKSLSAVEQASIIAFHKAGIGLAEMKALDPALAKRHHSTLSKCIKRHEAPTSSIPPKPRGRPRSTTPKQDARLVNMALQNRTRGARQHSIRMARGRESITLSESTIKRRLKEADLPARVIRRAPMLTSKHKVAPAKWCHERQNWSVEMWRRTIYDDEKIFFMDSGEGAPLLPSGKT